MFGIFGRAERLPPFWLAADHNLGKQSPPYDRYQRSGTAAVPTALVWSARFVAFLFQERKHMIITYANGRTIHGVILTQNHDTIRVAVDGGHDAVQFTKLFGTWVSDDCEPVQIRFEWERTAPKAEVSVEDCICPKELAAELIHRLFSGDEDEPTMSAPVDPHHEAMPHRVI